jgi:tetratricopeptide (TPR) repeat protein
MAAKLFISYRREDSPGYAGRIQDRLEREFGRDLLFIDVDGIPLGINFVKVLREEVAKCGVLLAVIGPDWLDVRDEDGNRRLDNPTDFVRIEIAAALQREIPVIPILLDGTRVPKADRLPEDLKELALRNGLHVRHASFHTDMDKLIRGLKRQLAMPRQAMSEPPPLSASTPRRELNGPELAPAQLSAAQALYDKGVALSALGRSAAEIAVYDDLLARFGSTTELPLRELVAKALVNKGFTLGSLGRSEEAIAVYDDVLARFGSATELPLLEPVTKALYEKGLTLSYSDRSAEEIAVYDDLLARFGSTTELPLRELVAKALYEKGLALGSLGRGEEAIAVYDDLFARFGGATELPLRELAAQALYNKGLRHDALGRSAEAIAVCDDLLARFATAPELPLRELIAKARVLRARLHKSLISLGACLSVVAI